VAIAASAGVGGWWYLSGPRIEPGSRLQATGDLRLVGGGTTPMHYEIDGTRTGTVWVSVRNAGRVPVTLTGLGDRATGEYSLFSAARWGIAPASGDPAATAMGTRPVRLPPDGEGYVSLDVAAPACAAFVEGSAMTVESLPLRVTSLGRESLVAAPLRLTMSFSEAHRESPGCP
jgi:hypothetical protein